MDRCLAAVTGAFHTGGGIAAVNRLVIRTLAEATQRIDIFALGEADGTADSRYVCLSQTSYQAFNGNKFRFATSVWRAFLVNDYDFVFVDHVNLASILAPLSRLGQCRYTVWLHGLEVFEPRPDLEGRIGLKAASRRLASSTHTREQVEERFPGLSVTACDLALDPVRHPLEPPPDTERSGAEVSLVAVDRTRDMLRQQVVLHVGQMAVENRDKGQGCLLEAFPAIHGCFPEAQLVLAGGGHDYSHLLSKARTLPPSVQRRIFMPGFVEDSLLELLYQGCYLFAMPSVGEGFGLTYLEAMSRAKPCLGGRVDATPCVVRDGETGVLVTDPMSPQQVADKIVWLLAHPQRAREMGLEGHRRVQEQYLFHHFKERFWQAIET